MSSNQITVVDVNKNELNMNSENDSIIPYNLLDVINKIEKPNCKLCQCDFREEAEMFYQKTENYHALFNWLKDKKNMDISYPAVRNHIIYHFKAQQQNEALVEYANDVKKWISGQPNRIKAIKSKMAILEREMVIIAALGEDLPIVERRKNAETLKKLADTLLVYQGKLEEYEKQVEPAAIVINELRIIITDEIRSNNNAKTNKVLTTVLSRLEKSDSIKNILVNTEN